MVIGLLKVKDAFQDVQSSGNDRCGAILPGTGSSEAGTVYGFTSGDVGSQTHVGGTDLLFMTYSEDAIITFGKAGTSGDDVYTAATEYWWEPWGVTAKCVVGYTFGAFASFTNAGGADLIVACETFVDFSSGRIQHGGASGDYATGVAVDTATGVYVTGYTQGSLDGQSFAGVEDAFLTMFLLNGTWQWTTLRGSASSDRVVGIYGPLYSEPW